VKKRLVSRPLLSFLAAPALSIAVPLAATEPAAGRLEGTVRTALPFELEAVGSCAVPRDSPSSLPLPRAPHILAARLGVLTPAPS
jgi:hypothetical protein